ncbi:MAG TPA: hypothetical protein GXZ97_06695 [Hydrogenispora sp.]|jgi:hypothetical protein|nr:hypothetical protein [Hydrogenispora sp.]
MKIDKTTTSIIVGALSTIPYEILTTVLKLLGYARYSVYELSSLMITLNRPHMLLGAFLSMTLGASIALILYKIAVECFGWENLIFKSVFLNLQCWILLEGLFMWLIEGRNLIPFRPISDYYSHLFSVIIFGVILGLLFRKYIKSY